MAWAAPSVPDLMLLLPKLIVFDLDCTLWPFWVDTHVEPPLVENATHTAATDSLNKARAFYDDVPSILHTLSVRADVQLAVASRTCTANRARLLLSLLHIPSPQEQQDAKSRPALDSFADRLEMYTGSKIKHFRALHRRTKIPYEDMLFFDDEQRNADTEQLGVTMWLIKDGLNWSDVQRGLDEWQHRRGTTQKVILKSSTPRGGRVDQVDEKGWCISLPSRILLD